MDMKIDLEPELAAIFEGKQTMWSVVEKESERKWEEERLQCGFYAAAKQ